MSKVERFDLLMLDECSVDKCKEQTTLRVRFISKRGVEDYPFCAKHRDMRGRGELLAGGQMDMMTGKSGRTWMDPGLIEWGRR